MIEDEDLLDEEEELADNEIWRPEPELEEDSLVMESEVKVLTKRASIRPSQFTEYAFFMPDPDSLSGYSNFSFNGRRHMRRIYDTPAKRILLCCARQCEKTTLLGNIGLCYLCMIQSYKVLYVSPSSTQTKMFSGDRVKEPIETSPVLKKFTTSMLSSNILEKQFVNRSKFVMRYAFLNADRCRGIASFMLMLDEFQDILADNIPVIEQCLSHAPEQWKRFIYAGTPKSLDNNIEYYRNKLSTQGEWVVPCDHHTPRHWNILGEKNIGKKSLVCEKCRKPLDPAHKDAQWARMVQEAPFESYRISQLMVPWKAWSEIVLDYERYPRDKFYNEVLGISYDSGLRPLTTEQVRVCCNPNVKMIDSKNYRKLSYQQPVFAGIDWGCHDEQTRILTDTGFKYFKDLSDIDQVAQWDHVTRKMTFTVPILRTIRKWDRPLLHFETKGGLDLMVTDTHRMRSGTSQGQLWVTETADKTAARGGNLKFVGHVDWDGKEVEEFILPGVPRSSDYPGSEARTFKMDDWLELLGYLISEGGVCMSKGRPSCLKMSQRVSVNQPTYEKMQACLTRMNIPHSAFPNPKTTDVNWTIYGKQFWKWICDNVGMLSAEKRIPRQFLDLSKRQLTILFTALVDGDGSRDTRENCTGGSYHSTSKGLCEDVQEVCIRLGLRAHLALKAPAEGNRKTRWMVGFSKGRDYQLNTPSSQVKRVPYQGNVYCCKVPTGYIVTERNGKISYQGNSGENSYTLLVLATYVDMKFRVFYVHRFTGEDVDPEPQLAKLVELLRYFNVKFIGTDYGGGFDRNDHLVRKFGPKRLFKYQYLGRLKKKVEYDSKLGRFKLHRTEVMSDIFNAIKRKQVEFPAWDEFEEPYAQDMLNIYSEYNNQLHMTQYAHSQDKPDDTFHALLYCWMASMVFKPRPDILTPRREDKRGFQEPMFGPPGTSDQG